MPLTEAVIIHSAWPIVVWYLLSIALVSALIIILRQETGVKTPKEDGTDQPEYLRGLDGLVSEAENEVRIKNTMPKAPKMPQERPSAIKFILLMTVTASMVLSPLIIYYLMGGLTIWFIFFVAIAASFYWVVFKFPPPMRYWTLRTIIVMLLIAGYLVPTYGIRAIMPHQAMLPDAMNSTQEDLARLKSFREQVINRTDLMDDLGLEIDKGNVSRIPAT